MSDSKDNLAAEKKLLAEASQKPLLSRWGTFAKLSGPGWLQGAITLGGGSLAGSLYIGVIGGYELLWLQPLMMIFGVLMLSKPVYNYSFQNRNILMACGIIILLPSLP